MAFLIQKNAEIAQKNNERLQLLLKTWKEAHNEHIMRKEELETALVAYEKVYAAYEEFQSVVGSQPHIGYFGVGNAKRIEVFSAERMLKKREKAWKAALDMTNNAEKAYTDAKAVEKARKEAEKKLWLAPVYDE